MLIAIDYDETFTEDPEFWRGVIDLGRANGHRFICVTGRSSPPDPAREPHIPILVLCAGGELKDVCARRAGYHVDVWVDDMPGLIKGSQLLHFDDGRGADLFDDILSHVKHGELSRADEYAELARLFPKDHRVREAVNELRDIAQEWHGSQQLRERIARVVQDLLGPAHA